MIVLICGGRNYGDRKALYSAMELFTKHHEITCVVQGGARGADNLAKLWCRENEVHMAEVCALWSTGKRAGSERNAVMLSLGVEYVIAFPGGAGTADMVRRAEESGISVWKPFPSVEA